MKKQKAKRIKTDKPKMCSDWKGMGFASKGDCMENIPSYTPLVDEAFMKERKKDMPVVEAEGMMPYELE